MKKTLQDAMAAERISDYLAARGVVVESAGSRLRCICPLPGHQETLPSFYVGQFQDGCDFFKCFGCGKSGNILSLRKMIEGKTSRQVAKEICDKHGVRLENVPQGVKTEPLPHEVTAALCEEDALASDITTLARSYLRSRGGCRDAVNKVTRLYGRLDDLNAKGDMQGMARLMGDLKALLAREGQRRASEDEPT